MRKHLRFVLRQPHRLQSQSSVFRGSNHKRALRSCSSHPCASISACRGHLQPLALLRQRDRQLHLRALLHAARRAASPQVPCSASRQGVFCEVATSTTRNQRGVMRSPHTHTEIRILTDVSGLLCTGGLPGTGSSCLLRLSPMGEHHHTAVDWCLRCVTPRRTDGTDANSLPIPLAPQIQGNAEN